MRPLDGPYQTQAAQQFWNMFDTLPEDIKNMIRDWGFGKATILRLVNKHGNNYDAIREVMRERHKMRVEWVQDEGRSW